MTKVNLTNGNRTNSDLFFIRHIQIWRIFHWSQITKIFNYFYNLHPIISLQKWIKTISEAGSIRSAYKEQNNLRLKLVKKYRKMPYFVSFSLFGFSLVIKLRNFYIESHWHTLLFLIKKIRRKIWVCPMEKCLILFHSNFLGSLQSQNYEI